MAMTSGAAAAPPSVGGPSGGKSANRRAKTKQPRLPGESRWVAGIFLLPAAVWLSAIVLYPLIYTLIRSFFHDGSAGQVTSFAGFSNYGHIFTQSDSFEAFKNNVIWVVFVPALITIIGLIFAVLTERVRWSAAFKIVVFTPMAISFLAAGITWSLIYVDQPTEGLGNAVLTGIHDTFAPGTSYPNLQASAQVKAMTGSQSAGFTSKASFGPGQTAMLPVTGLDLTHLPANAKAAAAPAAGTDVAGLIWNDFKLGGGGSPGKVDPGEYGVPDLTVQAIRSGKVVASTTTGDDGSFSFSGLSSGSYQVRLPASDMGAAYEGVSWLGPSLITPAIILSYLWIYAGFAMVLLAAGMSALPRETLEAARMDGATEWQVFRRVTMPLLAPVLMVVFVTMVINVLKIFDIVFVLQQPAGGNARYANVLAVQLYNEYGNQQYGAASAVGILLVILVVPAMIFQIRNFRKEQR
ncbi:MAG TPA: sugar ABC transporter permease [Nocardioides sp.]|jgi:alpha-glucoside transport system permease protein|uniref:carbohydrate ABC transporter permease n=1 Tax=Nocardioides sp. TaxID=35761 RepID=UPI002E31D442|nr:sugar ABC transporter permease [Nocardioides sp.]HEX3929626.1 sugar ABC transporter permease [Nocardioides sp.]